MKSMIVKNQPSAAKHQFENPPEVVWISFLAFNAINGVETIDIENLEIQDGAVPSINESAKEPKTTRKFNFSQSELREKLSKTEFEVTQEVQWEDRNKGRYINEYMPGKYDCVVCKTAIFDSKVTPNLRKRPKNPTKIALKFLKLF